MAKKLLDSLRKLTSQGEGVGNKWHPQLRTLARKLEKYVVPPEKRGSMEWPTIQNTRDVSDEELKKFISLWKRRGVFVEVARNNGDSIDLRITNIDKPTEGVIDGTVTGVWFNAWSERLQRIRQESMQSLSDIYGENNKDFNLLVKLGFHPGVWIGPDYEPCYFSKEARELILKNADKIAGLVRLCSERARHVSEQVATHAIPAVLALLNEHLTQEHIDSLYDSMRDVSPEARENLMAYGMQALVRTDEIERITPELLRTTIQKAGALIGIGISSSGRSKSTPPADLAKDIGEFIKKAGRKFKPEYIDSLQKVSTLARTKDLYFIDNLAASFFDKSHMEAPSAAEFEECLIRIQDLSAKFSDQDEARDALRSWIPYGIRMMHGEGSTYEMFTKVEAELSKIIPASSVRGNHILSVFRAWVTSPRGHKNEYLPVSDFTTVADRLIEFDERMGSNGNNVFTKILAPLIYTQDGYFDTQQLREYTTMLELMATNHPQNLTAFLTMDEVDIRHLIDLSKKVMTPDVLKQYITTLSECPRADWKTALMIYERCENDVDPDVVKKCLILARRLNTAVATIGSKIPVKSLPDITGHRGMLNDNKSSKQAITMAEHYISFIEGNLERVKELCPQLPKPPSDNPYANWDAEWKQQENLLNEYTKGHRGKLTQTRR